MLNSFIRKNDLIICDIDGCLIKTDWIFDRTKDMSTEEKWNFFNRNANSSDNEINYSLVNLVDRLNYFAFYKIAFITSRSDIIYKDTLLMLKRLFVSNEINLYMRKEGDKSESHIVKEQILNDLKRKYNIICAIDDDINNCKMYKTNGIMTLKVV